MATQRVAAGLHTVVLHLERPEAGDAKGRPSSAFSDYRLRASLLECAQGYMERGACVNATKGQGQGQGDSRPGDPYGRETRYACHG